MSLISTIRPAISPKISRTPQSQYILGYYSSEWERTMESIVRSKFR